MAKYEKIFYGDMDQVLDRLDKAILFGSVSASFEAGSDYYEGSVRCVVRVYERYSMIGSNRLSLTLTMTGENGCNHLVAIASGGSSAVFFKINRWGEDAFLDVIRDELDSL